MKHVLTQSFNKYTSFTAFTDSTRFLVDKPNCFLFLVVKVLFSRDQVILHVVSLLIKQLIKHTGDQTILVFDQQQK